MEQSAVVYLGEEVELEFDQFAAAAVSAAFEVAEIRFEARGAIVNGACERCSRSHGLLELEGSGQRFHLSVETNPLQETGLQHAKVLDWEESLPALEILKARDS